MPGTEDDFAAFMTRAWPGLVRTAVLLVGDHARAEDLAQAALVRAHRHWRRVSRLDSPDAYVRRILVNLSRSWWRRQRGREWLVAQVPERPDGDAGPSGAERDRVLEEALAQLPPRMRMTLVLRFYLDLSEYQVAQLLGCSVGTVKSQTSRGLARLRMALGPVGSSQTHPIEPVGRP